MQTGLQTTLRQVLRLKIESFDHLRKKVKRIVKKTIITKSTI